MKMKCKKCLASAYHKAGFVRGLQRYKCKSCGCFFTDTPDRDASMQTKLDALRLYTSGLGFRAIGRFLGYSNVSVLRRIRGFGALAFKIHENNKQQKGVIEIIEMDELRHYVKKKKKNFEYGRLCLEKGRLIDFALGDRSTETGKKLRKQLENIRTRQVCTDHLKAYERIIPFILHTQSKAETYTVEGMNSRIRHYLARFHRKTFCYSKMKYMVYYSLLLFMYADIIVDIFK